MSITGRTRQKFADVEDDNSVEVVSFLSTLVDFVVLVIRRKKTFYISFFLVVALGIAIIYVANNQYELTTSYNVIDAQDEWVNSDIKNNVYLLKDLWIPNRLSSIERKFFKPFHKLNVEVRYVESSRTVRLVSRSNLRDLTTLKNLHMSSLGDFKNRVNEGLSSKSLVLKKMRI